jgi:hypothetical protein
MSISQASPISNPSHRGDICVSIYLPTTPVSQETAGDRIELKNLARQALHQLEAVKADKRRVAALMEHLVDDDEFWRFRRAASRCWRLRTACGPSASPMR